MTFGKLLREVIGERGVTISEHRLLLADALVPDTVKQELTPEEVEYWRPRIHKLADEIGSMSEEQLRTLIAESTSNN